MPASEFGDVLRTCRAATAPGDVGLPERGHRRVPGLRREEPAQLVGLSTDYDVRLEQGRGGRPSPGVLDAMDVPALVMTRCAEVVAANALADRLLCDFAERDPDDRNYTRLLFADSELAARHADWEASARELVGMLRMTAGREPGNVRLQELVGELACSSDAFRRMWAEHHVHEKTAGTKAVAHPEVGAFELHYQTLRVACDDDLQLITYTAVPGTRGADGLALLRTLVADAGAVAAR